MEFRVRVRVRVRVRAFDGLLKQTELYRGLAGVHVRVRVRVRVRVGVEVGVWGWGYSGLTGVHVPVGEV